ncbi:hypothetical protein ACFE04_001588 [Oxalis oulophora]
MINGKNSNNILENELTIIEENIVVSEIKLEDAAVLHYTYAKYSDLTSRANRCGCKPTKEDVKRCFMLDFDRTAFIIASTATEEDMMNWYISLAIIQGLRDSGVFSSVIASAATTLSKEMFFASIESSNTSRTVSSQSLPSRKSKISQATARKTLGIETTTNHKAAVSPLSPPGMNDHQLYREESGENRKSKQPGWCILPDHYPSVVVE